MAEMEYNTGSVDPVEGYFKTICPTQANSNQLKYWCIMTIWTNMTCRKFEIVLVIHHFRENSMGK